MAARTTLTYSNYTVGWVCALPLEMAAAKLMLDALHPSLPSLPTDQNNYILGNIGEHNIVIACLPDGAYGTVSAATVAIQLLSSFHSIRFGLMVGIGGGVPSSNADIRLGDIMVSQPRDTSGGVIQYDLGKMLHDEDSRVHQFISDIDIKTPWRKAVNFTRPIQEDCLYQAEYDHDHDEPVIHYGLIASANQVVKDGRRRDQLAQDLGVYYVEMEAAGLMNDFPCVVIRGICDYADSHKNKEWQGYAATAAAAYAKELLSVVPINQIDDTPLARDTLADSVDRFRIPLDLTTVPQYFKPADLRRKVAILHRLGGIGKTQLAVQFAQEHKHDFTAIFWLSGKDRGTLLQSISSVLPRLPGQSHTNEAIGDEELEQRARRVLKWLASDGNSHWLIVFDNIDQYSPIDSGIGNAYDIGKFFPAADHGSILITSRLPALTDLGQSMPIHKLDSMESIQLLLKNSGLSDSNNIEKPDGNLDTLALAERLDGLPLAIVIAAAFMRQTGTSIAQYLEYYQQSWSDLQSQSSPMRHYLQGNMLQTWMISYREIQNRAPNAAELLLLLARFDNRDIWYELVQNASNSPDVPGWLEETISSGLTFKNCVKPLIGFSLLETKQQEGSYAMHPVVQDWCFHITSTKKNVAPSQLCELALISVGWAVPSASERNYSKCQRRLIPHANFVLRGEFYGENVSIWGACHGLGDLYSDQGKLKEAEEMYQRALAGYEKALGPDHTSTLDSVHCFGILYWNQGKLKEAEEMYQRALAGYEKALGPDHTSTLDTVNNLGALYKDQGKLKEAEEMYQRALAGREKALGPDHTSTLETVNNLGALYYSQGKLKEAEEMYQRALAGYEKALGPDHTSTLDTVNNLGALYYSQGKLKEAEEMYQRALAGREKALGPDHTSTLMTVNNLGLLYSDQDKLKEAEEMYQRALGKLKEAEEMYQRALAGREKALGPDHTSTLTTVNNLGLLYKNQGKLKEAEEMYQRALAGREKALGPDHTSTLDTVNNLGILYYNQGKLKEAEEMYQRALAGREKALGPDHTSTLDTVNNLEILYREKEQLKDEENSCQGPGRLARQSKGPTS
ncbi:hypothetical protein N7495_003924 [Penicillium taxi]|uniref:uncharacterized protein n=1 Tax=Penicillium taxi TaxID=168475 RepID=UPI0025455C8E|nr:uncharacterized protein N7495_003924 [Penicillium taxi]KAJ5899180.1 hypothetical protein N7495_003924 [Penicillium taxi]